MPKVYIVVEEIDQHEFYDHGDVPEPAKAIIAIYDSEESAIEHKDYLEGVARKEFFEYVAEGGWPFVEGDEPDPADYYDEYAYPSYYIEEYRVGHSVRFQ